MTGSTNRKEEPYGNVRVCCSCSFSSIEFKNLDYYRILTYWCRLKNKHVKPNEDCKDWTAVEIK